jgi:hypothetical protein
MMVATKRASRSGDPEDGASTGSGGDHVTSRQVYVGRREPEQRLTSEPLAGPMPGDAQDPAERDEADPVAPR